MIRALIQEAARGAVLLASILSIGSAAAALGAVLRSGGL